VAAKELRGVRRYIEQRIWEDQDRRDLLARERLALEAIDLIGRGGVMNLGELLGTCARSTREDWNLIGEGGGATYLNYFSVASYPETEQVEFGLTEHYWRASYKPDLDIGIAWGLDPKEANNDRSVFVEAWTQVFPDKSFAPQKRAVDFFYRGDLVHRDYYVSVDGGRCDLPIPERGAHGEPWVVSQFQHDFFRVLHQLDGWPDHEFDSHFGRAGFNVLLGGEA
jgi:hypothetical protein